MISSDISDIPWLNQPNPGEYMLQSTQVAQGSARNFMQAAQFAQESSREQALMPLRMQAMEHQIKSTALDVQNNMYRQNDYLANKAAATELSKAAAEISANGAWANPASETRIWDIAAQFPSVVSTPEFQTLVKQFDVAGAAAIKKQDAENRAASLENQLTLGRERIALSEDKYKSELASREKIAAESNETKLKLKMLEVDKDARDRLDDIEYRAFSEVFRAISKDERMSLTEKQRKIQEAADRAFEQAKSRKETNAPASSANRKKFNATTGKFE